MTKTTRTTQSWTKPELVKLGTFRDVAACSASGTAENNNKS